MQDFGMEGDSEHKKQRRPKQMLLNAINLGTWQSNPLVTGID